MCSTVGIYLGMKYSATGESDGFPKQQCTEAL